MKKSIGVVALILVIILLLGVCGNLIYNAVRANNQEVKNPVLSLEVENYGTVKIELYPEYAPNTVKNIIALADNGYYNGKIFYGMDDIAVYVGRNSEGETVNPKLSNIKENVENDYEYEIDGEFIANSFKQNTLKHEKGVVSLVRANYSQQSSDLKEESYNSGNSQFTIIMDEADELNGMYAAFGKITEGMDIVEKMYSLEIKPTDTENTENTENSAESIKEFAVAPVITSATVEKNGDEYGIPEVHEKFDYSAYIQDLMSKYYSTQSY